MNTANRLGGALRRATLSVALFAILALVLLSMASPAHAVEVQRVTGGGVEAWLVEDHTNPIITVRLAFRGGAALDPADKSGLAEMVAALLDEGAGDLDSTAFHERLEDLAISLSFDADLDAVSGKVETLSDNRDAAFALLRQALTAPRFDAEPVARVRSQLQARARAVLEDPDAVASQAFFAMAFPDHPYGRPAGGTADSLAAISVKDLQAFVPSRLTKDRLVIGVVGDVTADELAALLQRTFADLPAQGDAAAVADVEPNIHGQTVVVPTGAPQSAIVFGQRGLARDDPDFYAATVLAHILGSGPFTSRLYQEVREQRGLVYTVYASLAPLDRAALILGSAGTVNDRAGETLKVIRSVWSDIARNGVDASDLADAKTYLTGSFPLRFTSSGRIAGILVSMQLEHLGIDYLDRRNGLIEAVTLDDVNRLAHGLLAPDSLAFVVAGAPVGVEANN
ncbi:MAG: insulinase family protein [Rhodospirillales bacterium]|nr:insulinase family protein [Rhodospirillales bacterium]